MKSVSGSNKTNHSGANAGRRRTEEEKERQNTAKKVRLLESLQLPRDVCMGAMRVTLTGNSEAWVENYRGLLEYTDRAVLLQGKTCQVCFEGTGLTIDYYTNEDMKITGCIQNVRYM